MKNILFAVCLTILWLPGAEGFAATDHTDKITAYKGSKTCRVCHPDQADDVAHSLHYRLLGQTQGVYDFLTNKEVTGEYGKGNRY